MSFFIEPHFIHMRLRLPSSSWLINFRMSILVRRFNKCIFVIKEDQVCERIAGTPCMR